MTPVGKAGTPRKSPLPSGDGFELAAASQWTLILRRLARHRMAMMSAYVLAALYVMAAFAEFFAPYSRDARSLDHAYCPPQLIGYSLRYGISVPYLERNVDPVTFRSYYIEKPGIRIPLRLLPPADEPVRMFLGIPIPRRLFGVDADKWRHLHPEAGEPPPYYFLGADKYGRDIYSRMIFGSRISLSIGMVSIALTFVLGLGFGGISGYIGGRTDLLIQRLIEIINAFPQLPLWLAVAAVLPGDWSSLKIYFAITVVLSLVNWTGLARVVRGRILAMREEDYALAARLLGAGHGRIIARHLLPGFASHIIVSLTLSVPAMILGETALSFLGVGLRPPVVSWGVMLQDCMQMQVIANYPWLLMPVAFIVLTVLCFNFLGDGLRDAADPYASE